MNDKSFSITLIIVFGLSGLLLLIGAWTIPSLQTDKLTASLAGAIGIGFAAVRWILLRRESHTAHNETVPVRVSTMHHERNG